MSAFKRYATVAYDRHNFSILSIESISRPTLVSYKASDYREMFTNLFAPTSNDTSDNTIMVNAMLFQIGWLLRLYQDDFRDDQESPVNFLRNMLTIPIQFSTAAWQFANATAQLLPGLYALPLDMVTTASAARMTPRVMATPWTVYAFICLTSALYLWGASVLCWVLRQKPVPPNTSGFLEVDISSKLARRTSNNHGQSDEDSRSAVVDFSSILQSGELGNAGSSRIAQFIKGKGLRAGAMRNHVPAERHIVLAMVDEAVTRGDIELVEGSDREERLERLAPGMTY
jgi:hypothetical protein